MTESVCLCISFLFSFFITLLFIYFFVYLASYLFIYLLFIYLFVCLCTIVNLVYVTYGCAGYKGDAGAGALLPEAGKWQQHLLLGHQRKLE